MGSWKQIEGCIENVFQYLWITFLWQLCWCQLIWALRHYCTLYSVMCLS